METYILVLIIIHATAGGLGLLTGPGALMTKKGGKLHRTFGKIFYWSMIVASCFALVISNLPKHENFFLFTIGIFTLYMVLSGRRFLSLKMLFKDQKASAFDWALAILMGIAGGFMVGNGIRMYSSGNTIGVVLMVFGFLSLRYVASSILLFRKKNVKPNSWLLEHISRMIGANIAAFTAFMVVNNTFLPPLVAWLGPTVIFVPLIIYFTVKEKNGRAYEKP